MQPGQQVKSIPRISELNSTSKISGSSNLLQNRARYFENHQTILNRLLLLRLLSFRFHEFLSQSFKSLMILRMFRQINLMIKKLISRNFYIMIIRRLTLLHVQCAIIEFLIYELQFHEKFK